MISIVWTESQGATSTSVETDTKVRVNQANVIISPTRRRAERSGHIARDACFAHADGNGQKTGTAMRKVSRYKQFKTGPTRFCAISQSAFRKLRAVMKRTLGTMPNNPPTRVNASGKRFRARHKFQQHAFVTTVSMRPNCDSPPRLPFDGGSIAKVARCVGRGAAGAMNFVTDVF